jgi:DMSO/TMAO reductase YedYZ molybdopterin-dependent catalytic subunit
MKVLEKMGVISYILELGKLHQGGAVMKKVTTFIVISAIILPVLGLALSGCTANTGNNNTGELKPVEIREYEGENLSSVNDFRENSIKGPQHIDIVSYQLEITGLVQNPRSYTYDQVINDLKPYKKVVTLDCVEGWSATILWEGVLVRDLLNEAKPLPEGKVIIFHASDGYTTSLPLDYIMNNNILMAYKMNEITLPPERGFPFLLVAESKWGYKWIKWITKIELSDDVNYRGYWESRGYSNTADLDKSFFQE